MNSQHFYKIKITTKLSLIFVFFSLFLCNNLTVFAQKKEFVVVLDAGHGGKDPGKVGKNNILEKDIALDIVLQVAKLLENEGHIKVILTRKTDVFIDLWERGRIANKADADLFVSVHCNSWHTKLPNGVETYALGLNTNTQNLAVAKAENEVILLEDNYKEKYKGYDPNSPESFIGLTLLQEEYLDQSIQLASIIQSNLVDHDKSRDRGVKQAGFVVLHQTYMPSILIETGFLTNPDDLLLLNSASGRTKTATAIYDGIKTYIQQFVLNSVDSNVIVENSTKSDTSNSIPEEIYSNVEFKVQIASGSRKLETNAYNFNGLNNVERIKIGKTFKYYLGNTSNYETVKELQKLAISKGYTSAFIVAFKNGEKITIEEVLKKS